MPTGTDTDKPDSGGNRVLRTIWRVVFYGFLVFVALTLLTPMLFAYAQVTVALACGWWFFLGRVLPKISLSWDLIGMGLICGILILFGTQWFVNWMWQSVRKIRASESPASRWPWRLTWCGLAAVGVWFLVGMAVGGIAHQVGWIASSPEPMYEAKRVPGQDVNDMRILENARQQAELESKGNLKEMRRLMWSSINGFLRTDMATTLRESYEVLLIVETDGTIGSAIIFPRDHERLSRSGCFYYQGNESDSKPAGELAGLISRHRSKLVAL